MIIQTGFTVTLIPLLNTCYGILEAKSCIAFDTTSFYSSWTLWKLITFRSLQLLPKYGRCLFASRPCLFQLETMNQKLHDMKYAIGGLVPMTVEGIDTEIQAIQVHISSQNVRAHFFMISCYFKYFVTPCFCPI